MTSTQCIIETPKGSAIKYTYNSKLACFQVGKILPAGVTFPYDFGFIPGTMGEDGDALDVIVIGDFPTFPGCAIECRIIGSIKAFQIETDGIEVRNDRFIAIPCKDKQATEIKDASQLPERKLEELEQFFINYNEQTGKTFRPFERAGAKEALNDIESARSGCDGSKLVQLLLPLYDNSGEVFPAKLFKTVTEQLVKKFEGLTSYVHSPAKGVWKDNEAKLVRDEILVYEVIVSEIDQTFWKKYKKELKALFGQEDILIRHVQIGIL